MRLYSKKDDGVHWLLDSVYVIFWITVFGAATYLLFLPFVRVLFVVFDFGPLIAGTH